LAGSGVSRAFTGPLKRGRRAITYGWQLSAIIPSDVTLS
jgi:hypothetical protein